MENRKKKPAGAPEAGENSSDMTELGIEELAQVSGGGYSDDPEKKRRKLEEGKN